MRNGNEPAFPSHLDVSGNHARAEDAPRGLTKLEWFAGLAMQALLTRFGATSEDIAQMAIRHAETLSGMLAVKMERERPVPFKSGCPCCGGPVHENSVCKSPYCRSNK